MENKDKIIDEIKQFYKSYKEELTNKMLQKTKELSEKYNVDGMELFLLMLSMQGDIDEEDENIDTDNSKMFWGENN